MTSTDKRVQRVTRDEYTVLFPNCYRKRRRVVVSIEPGDVLTFREHGRRGRYSVPIDFVFGMAVKASAGFRLVMVPGPRKKKVVETP